MTTPKRIADFDYREFRVVIAQAGNQFVAVARDRSGRPVAEVKGNVLADVEAEMKHELNKRSEEYIGLDGAMNLFRKAFPGGFACWYYAFRERDYKAEAARVVAEALNEQRLRALIDTGDHGAAATLALQALAASNLCTRWDRGALKAALKTDTVKAPFAKGLHHLLYDDFDRALEELASLLKPFDAARWSVLTYWPFFRFPERHLFMQPTVVCRCAERIGYDLRYESTPNSETYRSLLGLAAFVREGIAALAPKDNIDVQSFIYVIGKEGYVRKAVEERERLESVDA